MVEVQKSFYVEMLNRQEANFLSFTKTILESKTTRIDGINKDVQEFKSSFYFSQAQIHDLWKMKKKVSSFESRLQSQSLSSQCMNAESKHIISKIDYLENWTKQLVIDSLIQDSACESSLVRKSEGF